MVKQFTTLAIDVICKNGIKIHKIVQFTDQAPSQYKNKRAFRYLMQYKVPMVQNIFGARHGKSSCDACTGWVKQGVSRLVCSGTEVVNSGTLFTTCWGSPIHLNFTVLEIQIPKMCIWEFYMLLCWVPPWWWTMFKWCLPWWMARVQLQKKQVCGTKLGFLVSWQRTRLAYFTCRECWLDYMHKWNEFNSNIYRFASICKQQPFAWICVSLNIQCLLQKWRI